MPLSREHHLATMQKEKKSNGKSEGFNAACFIPRRSEKHEEDQNVYLYLSTNTASNVAALSIRRSFMDTLSIPMGDKLA